MNSTATASHGPRWAWVDQARGLVMVLMVLDHVRHFFHVGGFTGNPLDPDTTHAALYATRWVTHLCAPVFVWLAGVSAWLRLQATGDRGAMSRFLASRGLWLIFLELTVINFAVNFALPGFGLQVIWALGAGMIALALLAPLGARVCLTVGAAIVLGHNLLDPVVPDQFGPGAPIWTFLHEGGFVEGLPVLVIYPVLPWIGVMALGFGMAPLLGREGGRIAWIGLSLLAGFLLLRGLNVYGDPEPWRAGASPDRTLFAFLDVEKYPPSLLFVLATLGVALIVTPLLGRTPALLQRGLETFGRTPLFFYIAHLFLIHGAAVLIGLSVSVPAQAWIGVMMDPSRVVRSGWGFDLAAVYGIWAALVALLYLPCRWYADLKARRRDWWLSYL